MQAFNSGEVTGLLKAWGGGDQAALDQLVPVVYRELQGAARRFMRNERTGHTLQTTALINELYVRLVDLKNVDWEHRAQFFALRLKSCGESVDSARSKRAQKRRRPERLNVDEVALLASQSPEPLVALDAALDAFAKVAPRQAKVLEMRYFGGLTEEEIAAVLKTSTRTVERDFQFAKT